MKILSSSLTPVTKYVLPAMFLVGIPAFWIAMADRAFAWIPAVAWTLIALFLLWWTLPIKKVALVGDRLLISNYWREIEVPVAHVSRIREDRWNRTPNVCLLFDPPTSFGRKIRIVVPIDFEGDAIDRVVELLEAAKSSPRKNA